MKQVREEANLPHFFRPIEYLADEMKTMAKLRREVSDVGMNVFSNND